MALQISQEYDVTKYSNSYLTTESDHFTHISYRNRNEKKIYLFKLQNKNNSTDQLYVTSAYFEN